MQYNLESVPIVEMGDDEDWVMEEDSAPMNLDIPAELAIAPHDAREFYERLCEEIRKVT